MKADDARAHSDALISAHTERLRALELIDARSGDGADPKIAIEIADIKIAIAELESHTPTAPIIVQARQAIRNQYANEWEFRKADEEARGIRQIQTANDLHDTLLTLEIESRRVHHVTIRNTYLIVILFILVTMIGVALISHMG